jgi:cell division protein YceG involved in septum cleavage
MKNKVKRKIRKSKIKKSDDKPKKVEVTLYGKTFRFKKGTQAAFVVNDLFTKVQEQIHKKNRLYSLVLLQKDMIEKLTQKEINLLGDR